MQKNNITTHLSPGMRVRNPNAPEWGTGQVQSVSGHRITVNFDHAGKQLILGDKIFLVAISEEHDVGEIEPPE